MVRIVFGAGLPEEGRRDVDAFTLGQALEHLQEAHPWLAEREIRCYVRGVDTDELEGDRTPVDVEDTVLVTEA